MWQPITVTGGVLQVVKGRSGYSEAPRQLFIQVTASGREIGIDPIKGVLGSACCEL